MMFFNLNIVSNKGYLIFRPLTLGNLCWVDLRYQGILYNIHLFCILKQDISVDDKNQH